MKLAVEFPSVVYREGPEGVRRLARAIEEIGFDQLDMFDHVIMGFATETRPAPIYPPQMPIMEALVMLAYCAAVTNRIGLGTEVLILPQRQPVLVAKQVSTLDTLSAGRVRLGVGVGWQAAEYESLETDFATRGQRMDEAIDLIRTCWSEAHIEFSGEHYRAPAIAMEPKSPQGGNLPIWIGGGSPRALRRVGELGDGWLAQAFTDPARARAAIATIHRHAEAAGRDPARIGLQQMLDLPPRDAGGKAFYADLDRVVARAEAIRAMGFGGCALNATAMFQAGARTVDALIDKLQAVHDRLRAAVG
ncbi:MAG: LLM class F420-dependent oxidoreductase [Pseudomonadales bacterium]|nr:LLM class F420-dependent oxidoreductase [Pseudomonadales bacterium]